MTITSMTIGMRTTKSASPLSLPSFLRCDSQRPTGDVVLAEATLKGGNISTPTLHGPPCGSCASLAPGLVLSSKWPEDGACSGVWGQQPLQPASIPRGTLHAPPRPSIVVRLHLTSLIALHGLWNVVSREMRLEPFEPRWGGWRC